MLGPKDSDNPQCDFIFDLHSTTSNVGILFLCNAEDTFALQVAAFVVQVASKDPAITMPVTVSSWPAGDPAMLGR